MFECELLLPWLLLLGGYTYAAIQRRAAVLMSTGTTGTTITDSGV